MKLYHCKRCGTFIGGFGYYDELCPTCRRKETYLTKEEVVAMLDKIRAEIEQLRSHKAQFLTNDNKVCIDSQAVLDILDKYKPEIKSQESEDKGI